MARLSWLPWLGRLAAVGFAVCGCVLLVAGPAAAHVGGSPAADNFSGAVTSVDPALPEGISVEIIEFGNRLRLTNTSNETVSVSGYSAEPYLEIGPDGVRRNENSPATYLNSSRDGTTPLPERADPLAAPSWLTVSSESSYEWHDHRTHWMSALLPSEVRADPDRSHRVIEWSIPLEIGGDTYQVTGVLDWTPPPAGRLSYAAVVVLLAVGVFVCWVRRSARLAVGLLGLGCAGSVWHAGSTPIASTASSSVVYAVVTISVPTVTVVVLTGLAVRAVRRQTVSAPSGSLPYLVGIAGWLMVAQALPDLDALFRSNVSALGPAWAARLAVLLLLGSGAGLAIGSIGMLRARPKAVPPNSCTAVAA